ncbi:hypothetical protein MRX96_030552 [Rhipicephalus microplus]
MTAVPRRRKPELRLRRCSLGGRSGRSGVTRRGHARTHPRLRQRCDVRPRAQLQRRELVRPSPTNGQAVGQPAPPAMSGRSSIGVIPAGRVNPVCFSRKSTVDLPSRLAPTSFVLLASLKALYTACCRVFATCTV